MSTDGPTLRVLFAEDNPVNQKVGQLLLGRLGHTAQIVDNGAEAVTAATAAAATDHPYDVVLMDVQMPVMDGLEATRRIRADLPAERQPRILAMTASVLTEDRHACAAAGMDGYLAKPVRRQQLVEALTRPRGATAEGATAEGSSGSPGLDRVGVVGVADPAPSELLRYSLRNRLAELSGVGDPAGDALVAHLVDSYLTRAPAFVDRLAAATAAQDATVVGNEAHGLGGMAANIGARTVPALCSALAAAAAAGDWSNAHMVLRRLGGELDAVRGWLLELRQR